MNSPIRCPNGCDPADLEREDWGAFRALDLAQAISDLGCDAPDQLFGSTKDDFHYWLDGELDGLRNRVAGISNRLETALKAEEPVAVVGGSESTMIFDSDLRAMLER